MHFVVPLSSLHVIAWKGQVRTLGASVGMGVGARVGSGVGEGVGDGVGEGVGEGVGVGVTGTCQQHVSGDAQLTLTSATQNCRFAFIKMHSQPWDWVCPE